MVSINYPGRTGSSMEWLNRPVSISLADKQNVALEECRELIRSEKLLGGLEKAGYMSLFPVQHALLENFRNFRDYGVVAPTGSGKTLAYIIPILSALMNRKIVRLRALVIVPTRVLVLQAHKTITDIISAIDDCDLKVGCATGKSALSKEQQKLFDSVEQKSRVDILVCTPGRLVEHLRYTNGFSLRDLQFLVIDEADRLLEQAYQDWLQLVYEATCSSERLAKPFGGPMEDVNWKKHCQLMKIILSASLTKKPAQLLHLHLNDPLLVRLTSGGEHDESSSSFPLNSNQFPDTLSHHFVVIPAAKKPLAIIYLLDEVLKGKRTLCFVNSTASAHKLARFIGEYYPPQDKNCHFVTAETDKVVMSRILEDFSKTPSACLIATDCLARGIHIPDIDAVINYDCPTTPSLYIHRAGRTARAGSTGSCFTILAPKEANYFKQSIMPGSKRVRPSSESLQAFAPAVSDALQKVTTMTTRRKK